MNSSYELFPGTYSLFQITSSHYIFLLHLPLLPRHLEEPSALRAQGCPADAWEEVLLGSEDSWGDHWLGNWLGGANEGGRGNRGRGHKGPCEGRVLQTSEVRSELLRPILDPLDPAKHLRMCF